jgi:hypothetical protein
VHPRLAGEWVAKRPLPRRAGAALTLSDLATTIPTMATVWRCSFDSIRSGVSVVNTFHVVARPNSGSDDPSADTVRDALDSALTTKYRAVLPTDATLLDLTVREELAPGDHGIPRESVKTIGSAGTRTAADTNLPPSMTLLATVRTNAAVRSGHGRLFLPLPTEQAALTGGAIWRTTNAFWLNSITFMNELLTQHHWTVLGLTAGNLDLVVYSRTRRERGDANYYFDATAYVLRPAPHWLRSRSTAP